MNWWVFGLWLFSIGCTAFGMYAVGKDIGHTEAMIGEWKPAPGSTVGAGQNEK